ncbi:MAG: hypothetical protein V2A34_02045 [Lentisphaerota bacterium]
MAGWPLRLMLPSQGRLAPDQWGGQERGKAGRGAPTLFVSWPSLKNAVRRIPDGAVIFDGQGEYTGFFHERSLEGAVSITSAWKQNALFNFLRNFGSWWVCRRGGLPVHAACVVRDGRAYVFTGKSGAGKTTICRLSRGSIIANDDCVAIRRVRGRFMAWGMPGKPFKRWRQQASGPFPIAGVFKLVQARKTCLEILTPAQALSEMLSLPSRLPDAKARQQHLDLFAQLVRNVPCFRLRFKKDPSFWNCIEQERKGRREP